MWNKIAAPLCILVLTSILAIVMSLIQPYRAETFEGSITSVVKNDVSLCKPIVEGVGDAVQKRIMEKKLVKVRNDGNHFMYFNSKKPFDNSKTYCYVNTFDADSPEGAPECSKTNTIYNTPIFSSVEMGAVMEKGDLLPRQVCIMEINDKNLMQTELYNFAMQVNNFDNKNVMDSIEQCREKLTEKTNQYNTLLEEHQRLQEQANRSRDDLEKCASEKNKLLQNAVLQSSALETLKNKVAIIDSHNVQSRIMIDVGFGPSSYVIPSSMLIGYVFMPPGYSVKFVRDDSSFFIVTSSDPSMISADMAKGITTVQIINNAASST